MPRFATITDIRRLEALLLGRTNIRPRSITEDKLAVGAVSAAIVRDGSISDIAIGTLTLDALTISGSMQSDNYVAGSAGWRIDSNGTANFYEVTVSATIEGGSIDIGGTDATSFHVDSGGNMWLGSGAFGTAPFSVSNTGALEASNVNITGGALNINSGAFLVTSAGAVTATNLTLTGGSLNINAGQFSVTSGGALTAQSATVTGAITAGVGSSIPAGYLATGTTAANLTIDTGGWVRSQNFVTGTSGVIGRA